MSEHAVAYFDGKYGAQLAADICEMKDHGAQAVVLCVPERQVKFNRQGMINAVAQMKAAGLKVYINFWGAFGIFGGEDFSGYIAQGGKACLKSEAFREALTDMLYLADESGADGVFWDEPELHCRLGDNTRCCETAAFIAHVTAQAHALGLLNEVCIPPLPGNWDLLAELAALPFVDIISSNTYYDIDGFKDRYEVPEIHVVRWSLYLQSLCLIHGKRSRMWLQGFKSVVMTGYEDARMEEWIPRCAAAARSGGVLDFGFWAHRACQGMSRLWPHADEERCASVWEAGTAAFERSVEIEPT